MIGEPLRLGPFVSGINHLSDPTALQDTELADAVNLDLDLDGSYIARPPFYDVADPSSGDDFRILGWYVTDAHVRLIAYTSTSLWSYETGAWTAIVGTGGVKATCMVQYDNKAYVIATPDSANDGGSIDDALAWTSGPTIKRGGAAVIHKERLFIVPGPLKTGVDASLLQGSGPANFTTWPVAVYINKGDGQKLIDLIVYNDNLMLFKEDSTYVLAYDADPTEAVQRKINSNIGVEDLNCVVFYENQLYMLHRNNVYEVVNYDFAKLNSKVPFRYDSTQPSPWSKPTFVTLLGDRLVVKYYAKLYVFGLKSRVWTRWDTTTRYIGPAFAEPIRDETNAIPTYYLSTAVEANRDMYAFRDIYDSANVEAINCSIVTKNYDFGVPHRYKKLFWWGVDLSTTANVTGEVQPLVVNFPVKWGDLSAKTWGDISGNTWGQPLNIPIVSLSIVPGTTAMRKFIKFPGALRFRQASFEVRTSYDGTDVSGPVRLFTLTAIVGNKQHVAKEQT